MKDITLFKHEGSIYLKKISSKTDLTVDPDGFLIDSSEKGTGRVCCYDKHGRFVWDLDIGKGHSVPIIDGRARLYVGSWRGEYICLQT